MRISDWSSDVCSSDLPDIEERTIDTAAALCIAQKNIAIKAVNQTASQCIANGGNADVDYGDSCGIGGSVTCMQNGGGEGPGERGGCRAANDACDRWRVIPPSVCLRRSIEGLWGKECVRRCRYRWYISH